MQKLLNDQEASLFLGLRPSTLRNWRTLHKGPCFVRVGGRIFYRVADLEAYLERRTVDPETLAASM